MGKWKKNIPSGTRDILFQDCADKKDIENVLRKFYVDRGFLEVITPTLEFYDVFDGEEQGIEQEKLYKLFDNHGRILTVRPDITIPIARLSGTKLRDSYYPLRFCYCENVFRANENLNGKRNEFTQSGVEIIGSDDLRADVEMIVLAVKALIATGVENFKIELGHAEFFKGIIEELPLNEEDKESIRAFIENKNYGSLGNMLSEREDILDKKEIEILNLFPSLFGDISIIEKAKRYTNNKKSREALNSLEYIYKRLEDMGLAKYIYMDLGMVHHLDYYTGLIFRGYIEGAGDYVLYGGRYDSLVSNFGAAVPATGFAIDVDGILEVLNKQNRLQHININADYIVHCPIEFLNIANDIVEHIIAQGKKCEMALFPDRQGTIEYAEKKKINDIIFVNSYKEILIYNTISKNIKKYEW